MNKQKRILIDCDTGVDDALAIIFALQCDSLKVDSITTVNGNVDVNQVTKNTLRILEFMNRPDIPVVKGADKPWVVAPKYSDYIFGLDGLGNASEKLPLTIESINLNVSDFILNKISAKEIDSIVAIGPLTNIANAYKANKGLMNSLKEIIVMGGAINVNGNITKYAEFNFYSDPHAAEYVLENSTNLTLIPLDVTTKVTLTSKDLMLILNSSLADIIEKITKLSFEFSKSEGLDGISLHDPLAVGYAIIYDFVKLSSGKLKIIERDKKRGKCIFTDDIRNKNKYAIEIGAIDFKQYFIYTLNNKK